MWFKTRSSGPVNVLVDRNGAGILRLLRYHSPMLRIEVMDADRHFFRLELGNILLDGDIDDELQRRMDTVKGFTALVPDINLDRAQLARLDKK